MFLRWLGRVFRLSLVALGLTPAVAAAAGWSAVPVPRGSGLESVACLSSRWCEAVGSWRSAPAAEHWSGSRWTIGAAPGTPAGAYATVLSGIACTSERACVAVGEYTTSATAPFMPLTESFNGIRWRLGSAPKPQRGTRSELNAVACPSSKLCFAVGGVIPTGHGNVPGAPLIERFNGARWQLEASPEATGPLDSISCSSRSACTAVGGWESFVTPSTPVYSSVAERWNGSGWSLQSFPAPAGATGAGLLGVSCLARQCGAVGSAQFTDTYAGQAEPGVDHVLVGDWVASSWSTQALPFPRGVYRGSTSAPRGWLYGISCASSRSCAAVGEYVATNGDIGPLAADWDGAAWSETALRRGPVALKSVACPSSGWCMAVGATIAERYTG